MLQTWFLVLVFADANYGGIGSVAIPQANKAQCEINRDYHASKRRVVEATCIVGAMPK